MERAREPRVGGPPRAEKNYLNAAAKKQEEWHLRLRASHLKAVKGGPSLPSRHSLPLALGLYPEDIAPRTDHCYSSRDAAASLSHRKQLTASTPLADALASAQSSRLLAEASAAAAPRRWSRGACCRLRRPMRNPYYDYDYDYDYCYYYYYYHYHYHYHYHQHHHHHHHPHPHYSL